METKLEEGNLNNIEQNELLQNNLKTALSEMEELQSAHELVVKELESLRVNYWTGVLKNLRKNFFEKKNNFFFQNFFQIFFCKPPSHDKQTDQQEEHGKELQRIKEAGEEELIETKTKLADMDKNVTTLNCQISTLRVFGWVKIQCAPKIAEIWSKKKIFTKLN